jgi:lipid-A-disaccharide synthase
MYRDAGVPVRFVGHPLVDLARAQEPRESYTRELRLDPARPIVALLPGSRPNEVERLPPLVRDAVAIIAARMPHVQFVVARAPSLDDHLFSAITWNRARPVEVLARTDDVLAMSDVAKYAQIYTIHCTNWIWLLGFRWRVAFLDRPAT